MSQLTPARERFLAAVYRTGATDRPVSVASLARELEVSAPSASTMISRLVADGLARRVGRRVVLTATGERAALQMIRRHRLVETYLVEVLGLSWDEVHSEAQRLEHAVSDRVADALDAQLGHPARDPHGDPIPQTGTDHDERAGSSLRDVPVGAVLLVERVRDRDGAALRELARIGAVPGTEVVVTGRDPETGSTSIGVGHRQHRLDCRIAAGVHGRIRLAAAPIGRPA